MCIVMYLYDLTRSHLRPKTSKKTECLFVLAPLAYFVVMIFIPIVVKFRLAAEYKNKKVPPSLSCTGVCVNWVDILLTKSFLCSYGNVRTIDLPLFSSISEH